MLSSIDDIRLSLVVRSALPVHELLASSTLCREFLQGLAAGTAGDSAAFDRFNSRVLLWVIYVRQIIPPHNYPSEWIITVSAAEYLFEET